jgi:transposase
MTMHPKMMHVYVGVDVHRQTHTAVILNCFFEKLGEITFQNKPSAFPAVMKDVKKHLSSGITPIFGLEDVGSYGRELAVFLIGKKEKVKYVNATLTYTERKNQNALHKTDAYDAECVAKVLLSKLDTLPDAQPNDLYWALSEMVTKRHSLVKSCMALKNQVHNYISHHYPSYKKFFAVFEGKTSLQFWEKYPSPSRLKGVSVEELTMFLKENSHNMYTKKKAKEILDYIEKDGDTTAEYQSMRDFIVITAIKQIKENQRIIKSIEEEIQNILPLFNCKLETMPGISYVTASALLSEIGDINRFSSPAKLAKYAGIAPVQYSSGQSDNNFSNRRGNRNLNQILFFLAVSQCNDHGSKGGAVNSIFAEYYKKKISEGKTKKQAIKCVMRRLVNIIYRMIKQNEEYKMPNIPNLTKE